MISNVFNYCIGLSAENRFFIILNLLTITLKCFVYGKGCYTIIAPNALGPNSIYEVSVSSHKSNEPIKFDIGISGPSYNKTNSAELPSDTMLNLKFDIPFLEQGEYRLMIESLTKSLVHRNATELKIKESPIFAFEEIEKKIYQPGDMVRFRVFIFDRDFFPLEIQGNVRVYFMKNDGLFIKIRHLNISNKGVLTGFAQLPDSETDNWWHMDVYLGYKRILKSGFEVKKIVLDYFDIKLTATTKASIKHPFLKINITSKFKNGQPVEGKANFKIHMKCRSGNEYVSAPSLYKIIDMCNGRAEVDLNLITYKEYLRHDQYCDVQIFAEVQALHFQTIKTAFISSSLYFNQYDVKNLKTQYLEYFVPNKIHDMPFSITYLNGSVIQNYKKIAALIYIQEVLHYKYPLDAPQPDENSREQVKHVKLKKLKFLSYLNENGQCTFKVSLPKLPQIKGFKNQFRTELIFDRELYKLNTLVRQNGSDDIDNFNFEDYEGLYEPKKKSLKIRFVENNDKFLHGHNYNLTINSTIPFSYIAYNLIARGSILYSKLVEFNEKTTCFNMSIEISYDMFPRVAFYAYFIDENRIFHSDEKLLPITLNFTNKIEVFAPYEAEPGTQISLRIKTTPNSKIALFGFDVRHADTRTSKNFDKIQYLQQVLKEENIWRPFRDYVSYYPGTESGVYTLTNAHYYFEHKKYTYANQNDDDYTSEYDLYDNNRMSYEMILPNPEREYAQLQKQSFEFLDIKSSENGEILWNLTVPNVITNWIVSATSWNPNLEIGTADTFFDLKVIKKFFIQVVIPENNVKRGEVIKINAIFTNNYNKPLDVQAVLEENFSKFEFTDNSVRSLHISSKNVSGVYWTIRPKVFGIISLKISGLSSIANDVVETNIKVLPEGNIAPFQNRTYGINLFEMPNYQETFELNMPRDAIANSQIIKLFLNCNLVKLLSALVGQESYKNEEKTLETALKNYLSNYLLLKYEKSKTTITLKMEKKLLQHINSNYENVLSYRLKDGSFKVLENSSTGSTYWTANVLLNIANNPKCIEDNIIARGMEYLASRQSENGSFVEQKNTKTSQSNPMDNVLLTAFVLLVFLEKNHSYSHQIVINKGLTYLKEQKIYMTDETNINLVDLVLSKSGVGKSTRSAEFRRIAQGQNHNMQASCWCYFYENQVSLGLCLMEEILKTYDQNSNMSITIKTTGVEPLNEIIQINRTSSDSFYLETPLGTKSVTISARGLGLATVLITFSYSI